MGILRGKYKQVQGLPWLTDLKWRSQNQKQNVVTFLTQRNDTQQNGQFFYYLLRFIFIYK